MNTTASSCPISQAMHFRIITCHSVLSQKEFAQSVFSPQVDFFAHTLRAKKSTKILNLPLPQGGSKGDGLLPSTLHAQKIPLTRQVMQCPRITRLSAQSQKNQPNLWPTRRWIFLHSFSRKNIHNN